MEMKKILIQDLLNFWNSLLGTLNFLLPLMAIIFLFFVASCFLAASRMGVSLSFTVCGKF
jgi:hypothetical protein